ncbi:hypothetical protein JW796_03610 [Candidatus Dojkabacteria bacterium]|nr:hypothetical protein [Candidatus Dojkabacteria bacterium]
MKLKKRDYKIIKWVTRILATAVIIFGLPFYFGYGNPLPFIKSEYSIWDNVWLTVFLLMFIGLGLGWKFEKIGGFLTSIPILIGFIIGFIVERDLTLHMVIPFLIGVLYIFIGFTKKRIEN